MLFEAFRTDPVSEGDTGMLLDIVFDLFPVSFIVAYLFAPGTDRDQAP